MTHVNAHPVNVCGNSVIVLARILARIRHITQSAIALHAHISTRLVRAPTARLGSFLKATREPVVAVLS